MSEKLPTRLLNEPLVDAIFECRFESVEPASNVLPGYLVGKLDGAGSVERLPAMELPPAVRNADPNLLFAALIGMAWKNFRILIGDRSLVVSCVMPYPGWGAFRSAIHEVLSAVANLSSIQNVQRFSMKYTDLIPAATFQDQAEIVDLKLNIGRHSIEGEFFDIRTEFDREGFRHILRVVSGASANFSDGTSRQGLVIETDTLRLISKERFSTWASGVGGGLDAMHKANKSIFFGCLSEVGLSRVEPEYV